jgi:hypothetical protein
MFDELEGPVTIAACAFAGIHANRTAGGREFGLDPSIIQFSTHFFNACCRQIQERIWQASSHQSNNFSTISPPALTNPNPNYPQQQQQGISGEQISTVLSEMDILAVMQLFQYMLFSGETPKNFMLLEIAYRWLEQSSIALDSNPLRALAATSPLYRMVVKMVIVSGPVLLSHNNSVSDLWAYHSFSGRIYSQALAFALSRG